MNAAGRTQANNEVWWSFTAGPGVSGKTYPFNEMYTDEATTLQWDTSAGATSYEYCVDTTNDSACSTGWTSAGTSTTAWLGGLAGATTYCWEVRARNLFATTNADKGTWWSFTVRPRPPDAITGTVSDAATATALFWAGVEIFDNRGLVVREVQTNGHGVYTAYELQPGSYFVRTTQFGNRGYIDELFDNIPCPRGVCTVGTGTPIVLASGGTGTASFALTHGATVFGTVRTASSPSTKLANVRVDIHASTGAWAGDDVSNEYGTYVISGLLPGSYFAHTTDAANQGFIDQLFNNMPCPLGRCLATTGTPIVLASGGSAAADFAFEQGTTITGTVTNASTSAALANIKVVISDSPTSDLGSAYTNASGVYTFGGLPPGSYFARTTHAWSFGYADELFDNIPCRYGSCTLTMGTPIVVPAGGTATANFGLAPSALPTFTDDPLEARITTVKAVHIIQLRQAIEECRIGSTRGVSARFPFGRFTQPPLSDPKGAPFQQYRA